MIVKPNDLKQGELTAEERKNYESLQEAKPYDEPKTTFSDETFCRYMIGAMAAQPQIIKQVAFAGVARLVSKQTQRIIVTEFCNVNDEFGKMDRELFVRRLELAAEAMGKDEKSKKKLRFEVVSEFNTAVYEYGLQDRRPIIQELEAACRDARVKKALVDWADTKDVDTLMAGVAAIDSEFCWGEPLPIETYYQQDKPPVCPLDVLRDTVPELYDLAKACEETLQVPVDLPVNFGLSTLAIGIAGRADIEIRPHAKIAVNIWTMTALASGERKSPVVRIIRRPIDEWQTLLVERDADTIRKAKLDRAIQERRFEALKKKYEKAEDEAERQGYVDELHILDDLVSKPLPVLPRLLVDDITVESVAEQLAGQGGKLASLQDEATFLEVAMGRYSGKPNLELLMKAYDGDSYLVDRKGKEPLTIPHCYLTLGIAVQPDVLSWIVGNPIANSRGFIHRFLLSRPSSNLGKREFNLKGFPPDVEYRWGALVKRLLADKTKLILKPDFGKLVEYENKIERRIADDYRPVASTANKSAGQALRIASVLHIAAGVQGEKIQDRFFDAATTLADYYLENTLQIVKRQLSDHVIQLAEKIRLAYIEQGKQSIITNRDVSRYEGRSYDRATLEDAYSLLVEANWLKPIPQAKGKFRVNPTVYQRQR